MKKFTAILISAAMVLSFAGCADKRPSADAPLTEIYDRVFDVGTYTELDYEFAGQFYAEHYDNWGGACTAVAKTTDDGTMLIGRNMDLTLGNQAAYILRTKVPGCYETVGLVYTFREPAPLYEDVLKNGIPEDWEKILPFMSDDVLNSEGFYAELNMRYSECWPDGADKFGCTGTNPGGERVYVFALPRYLGEHCATVDEALDYVKTLDLYSKNGYWGYAFILADASGRYGLLEIAQNRLIWHEGQQAQANFYIDEELAAIEEYKCGVGRYDTVMGGIDAVQSEEEMFALIAAASYYQSYFPEECGYDWRSEFVGEYPEWTYDYVMDEANLDVLLDAAAEDREFLTSATPQELRDAGYIWVSVFTEVVNCNARTLFVRFYEENDKTLTLGFES